MYAQIDQRFGRLNVLLHTAGVLKGAYVPLEDFSLETFRTVLEINTIGSFLCVQHSVPLFEKAGKGVIVLVSSGAATGGSSSFAYGTSKGGVNSLGVLFNNALGAKNIRVNVVSPGNIDTPMKRSVIAAEVERRGSPVDFDRAVSEAHLGKPEGVARVLAWLASDEADYVRGMVTTR
jgi:NAD(P)-dependent dehydrogenase (short-subunit alcohol dehydrogenase family)